MGSAADLLEALGDLSGDEYCSAKNLLQTSNWLRAQQRGLDAFLRFIALNEPI
jgi:hypothetical protein